MTSDDEIGVRAYAALEVGEDDAKQLGRNTAYQGDGVMQGLEP